MTVNCASEGSVMSFAGSWKVERYRDYELDSTMRAPLVCIVENDGVVARLAVSHLERGDFAVQLIPTRGDEIQRLQQLQPTLIIIELTNWNSRGLELCRSIRKTASLTQMPVILVAKDSSEEERITGLEAGADDYIAELFGGRELVARVRSVLRRCARQALRPGVSHGSGPLLHFLAGTPAPAISTGDLEIDTCAMKLWVRGVEMPVTTLEFRLIYYLAHNQARVFTRDQLLDAVWGRHFLEARSVDACVRRLRNKIEPDPKRPAYLKTIRGVGYCFHAQHDQASARRLASPLRTSAAREEEDEASLVTQ